MGLPLPNTNATVQFCAYVLSLHHVQLVVVVINCGDAKCIVDVADVILVANVGQKSRVDQTTISYKTTLYLLSGWRT